MKYDVLFLHPPRFNKDNFIYPIFPTGLIPLADLIDQQGYSTKIINLSLEQILNPTKEIKDILKNFESNIFAIDLHWWSHSYDSIELARLCKEIYPNSKIILGGITASFFAQEIINRFNFIDYIILGEAEFTFPKLVTYITKNNNNEIKFLPNLVFRNNNQTKTNPIKYTATSSDLNKLNFTNFKLLHNFHNHLKLRRHPQLYDSELPWLENRMGISLGRGCKYNCCFCGGSCSAFKLHSNRTKMSLRSTDHIIQDIKTMDELGIHQSFLSHSSVVSEKYWNNLLKKIKQEKIEPKLHLELWQPISPKIILKLNKLSTILTANILAMSINQKTRNKIGIQYSNFFLKKSINKFKKQDLIFQISTYSNLPFQSKQTEQNNRIYCEKLRKKDIKAENIEQGISLEPASLMFLTPNKFQIKTNIRNFTDYYNSLKNKQTTYDPSFYTTKTN